AKTRVRRDHVDRWGSVTLRYRRKLHHISVGRAHRHEAVIILMADLDVRVVSQEGELLRHFTLDPTRDYQARSRGSL
ncbi:MAG: IS481 family transposase, partial [Acidimicrobiales bacterium]